MNHGRRRVKEAQKKFVMWPAELLDVLCPAREVKKALNFMMVMEFQQFANNLSLLKKRTIKPWRLTQSFRICCQPKRMDRLVYW